MKKMFSKKQYILAFIIAIAVILIIAILLLNFRSSAPIDVNMLDEKYQYVYKVLTTKTIDSEFAVIAEYQNDHDLTYSNFKIDEVIFGELNGEELRVRIPSEKMSSTSSDSYENPFVYGYYNFLSGDLPREELLYDLKEGERYLIMGSRTSTVKGTIYVNSYHLLVPEDYPFCESDIVDPDNFVRASEYIKFVSDKIGFDCPEKYPTANDLSRKTEEVFGFKLEP